MKSLQTRLQLVRNSLGVPWEVLERDYLLSWILAGINQVPALQNSLVFKGGTALKKCYFGDYRFSEDLDFTALTTAPRQDALYEAIQQACEQTVQLLDEYAPVKIICERYTEREPHPAGQEAFTLRTRFPWHRTPQARVMIEITFAEEVLRPIQSRSILHAYDELLTVTIPVYALEEIIAEKLRAILQHAQKLKTRGWSRSRARDYYDIWRILNTYRDKLDLDNFQTLLRKKCAAKNVGFEKAEDFFEKEMLEYIEQTWEQWLAPLVPNLPAHEQVITELKPQIESIIYSK
jgi:predicted nucleotidyltransferase component of viral defense system